MTQRKQRWKSTKVEGYDRSLIDLYETYRCSMHTQRQRLDRYMRGRQRVRPPLFAAIVDFLSEENRLPFSNDDTFHQDIYRLAP
jgi:hypothetical protein